MVDLKLVSDYINGEDLNCDVEVLENNPEFMLEVLKLSGDSKMYELCSDAVKSDFNFVVGVIDTFSTDQFDFVKKVASKYLDLLDPPKNAFGVTFDENEDRIHALEISILVSEVRKEKNLFMMKVASMCLIDETRIEAFRKYCSDSGIKQDLGLGFLVIIDRYNTSRIIQDFYAKRFLNDIFYSERGGLASVIHGRYRSSLEVSKRGVTTTIIDIIRENDVVLSDYVMTHPELLSGLKEDMNNVFDDWDGYMERLNRFRVGLFEDEVSKLVEMNGDFSYIDGDGLVTYTVCRTGHEEEFIKYDPLYKKDADTTQFFRTNDFATLKAMKFAGGLINDLFRNDVVSNVIDNYIDRDNDVRGQAIIYDISQK